MRDDECKNGAKVICVMTAGNHVGKIGYLYNVVRHEHDNRVRHYNVQDSNGYPISNGYFSYLDSWDRCSDAPSTLKSAGLSKPLSRECPCGIARTDCDYHK